MSNFPACCGNDQSQKLPHRQVAGEKSPPKMQKAAGIVPLKSSKAD
jgi:hypothetical protein